MKILPSLKQKKRYLVFEIISENKFSASDVEEAVLGSLHDFIGILGMANAAPLFIKDKFTNNRFILKVSNKYTDEAKVAVSLIKSIKNQSLIITSLLTTGMIKKAYNEVLK